MASPGFLAENPSLSQTVRSWRLSGAILQNPLALACLQKQHQVSDRGSAISLKVACPLPPQLSGSLHADAAEPCKTLAWAVVFQQGEYLAEQR